MMGALGRILLAGALGCAFCMAPAAWGQGSAERFRIRPSLEITLVGDDNVHHEKRDGESAFGSWIAPNLALDYRRGRFRAGGEIGADVRLYTGGQDLNQSYYLVAADLEYQALRGVTLRLSNVYAPQPVWLGRPTDDTGNLVQSNTVRAEARLRREFKRSTALELGVQTSWFTSEGFTTSIDLHQDGVLEETDHFHPDHRDYSAFLEGQYSLGRRALLFARGRARLRDYEEIPRGDYTEFSGVLGMRTDWGRRIWLEIAFGYGSINWEGLPSEGRFVGRATLNYQLPKGWALKATFGRTLTSQAVGTDFSEDFARLDVEKLLGRRTRAFLGFWWNSFASDVPGERENSSTAVELGLRRQLTRRIEAVLAYRYWSNGGRQRTDDFRQNRVTLAFSYRY
jgi:hypothetical protein